MLSKHLLAVATALIGSCLLAAVPARANTYDFTLTDAGTGDPVFNVTGVVTTQSVLNGGNPNGYDITDITGTLTYASVNYTFTGAPVGGNVPLPGNNNIGCCLVDNVLINGLPWISNTGGWAFTASNGYTYNPYWGGAYDDTSSSYYYLYGTDPNAQANGEGSRMNLTISVRSGSDSQTPLPAALPLFATGLGAMGLLGWRRKRKNTAVIAAG